MHSGAEGNWVTEIILPSGRKRLFYINVCRPVLPITAECDENAGVCAVDIVDNQVTVCFV